MLPPSLTTSEISMMTTAASTRLTKMVILRRHNNSEQNPVVQLQVVLQHKPHETETLLLRVPVLLLAARTVGHAAREDLAG